MFRLFRFEAVASCVNPRAPSFHKNDQTNVKKTRYSETSQDFQCVFAKFIETINFLQKYYAKLLQGSFDTRKKKINKKLRKALLQEFSSSRLT